MRQTATASSTPYGKTTAIGWRGPHGPAVALLQRGYSKDDDTSLFLGGPGHIAWSDAPQMFMTGQVLRCLFHDDEGVYVAGLTSEGIAPTSEAPLRLLRDRERIAAPTRSLVMSTEGDGCIFALADPDGVRVGSISSRGEPTLEKERWITQIGATPHVALGAFLGKPLIAMIRPGERELVIARREGERLETVNHELHEPALDVAMDVAGSKGCLAVLSLSGHRIDTTMLDGQGRMTGRLAMLIEDTQLKMTSLQVLWVEDGFRIFGYDSNMGVVVGFRVKDARREFQLGGIRAQPHVAYRQKKVELFSTEPDADGGATIHVVRAALDGGGLVRSPLRVLAPRSLLLEHYEADAREFLGATSRVFLGEGYRGMEGQHIEKLDKRVALDLVKERQRIELSVREGKEPTHLLRLRTEDRDGAPLEEVDDSFARLAGWLRSTFSKDTRTLASREAAWVTHLAKSLVDESAFVSARMLVATAKGALIEVELRKLPDPDVFARWLRRVSEELDASKHREG
jgi:hypothetical protein